MNRGRKRKNSYGGGGHMPPQGGGGNRGGPSNMLQPNPDAKRMRRGSDASLQGRREPGGGGGMGGSHRSPAMLRPPSDVNSGNNGPLNTLPEWKRGGPLQTAEPMLPQAPTFNDPLFIAAQKACWEDHQNNRGVYIQESYAAGAAPLEQYLIEKVILASQKCLAS